MHIFSICLDNETEEETPRPALACAIDKKMTSIKKKNMDCKLTHYKNSNLTVQLPNLCQPGGYSLVLCRTERSRTVRDGQLLRRELLQSNSLKRLDKMDQLPAWAS